MALKPTLSDALINLRPGANFLVYGSEYIGIKWCEPEGGVTVPSELEVSTEFDRLTAEWNRTEYQRNRALEYPPIEDYLDAVYWQLQGDGSKMVDYLGKIEAVKNKYPKE